MAALCRLYQGRTPAICFLVYLGTLFQQHFHRVGMAALCRLH
jgi:hypothetical protein